MTRVPASLLSEIRDRDDVAQRALRHWTTADAELEFVSAGASFTYRFGTRAGARYLRLTPPGWRSEPEIRGEIAFIEHVEATGIAVAPFVRSLRANLLETVDTSHGTFIGAVFDAVDGEAPVAWSPEQAHIIGRLMARMHLAAQDFELPPGTARLSWRQEFRGLDGELLPVESELRAIADETLALFESLPGTPDCYGVIHYDLSGDNVVWSEGGPVLIDFDDCMSHWYIADLARTIGYYRAEAGGIVTEQETAMVAGYSEVRPLEPKWQRLLRPFVRFAVLLDLAWMSYATRTAPGRFDFTADDEARLRRVVLSTAVDSGS